MITITKFLNQIANFSGKVDNLISSISNKAANFSNKADNFIFTGLNTGLAKATTFSNKVVGLAFSKMVEEDSDEYINSVDKISKFPTEKASTIVEPSAPEMPKVMELNSSEGPAYPKLIKSNFSFHKENTIKIIFNDNTESNNFKVVTDYGGELGKGNTIYYYEPAYKWIHMMIADMVMASDHKMEDIKKLIVNGDDFDFYHMCVPTIMKDPASHQQTEHIALTEDLLEVLINRAAFTEAHLGEVDFSGCIVCIPV